MEFRDYKELVKIISVGKQLPDAIYVHETALDAVPLELAAQSRGPLLHLDLIRRNGT